MRHKAKIQNLHKMKQNVTATFRRYSY